ncbi:hypothetical protein NHQ30_000060 [Ciborinia camelliae]|nr:hypothetical protein NHQ30_000060 [Ciborinia camelliae]
MKRHIKFPLIPNSRVPSGGETTPGSEAEHTKPPRIRNPARTLSPEIEAQIEKSLQDPEDEIHEERPSRKIIFKMKPHIKLPLIPNSRVPSGGETSPGSESEHSKPPRIHNPARTLSPEIEAQIEKSMQDPDDEIHEERYPSTPESEEECTPDAKTAYTTTPLIPNFPTFDADTEKQLKSSISDLEERIKEDEEIHKLTMRLGARERDAVVQHAQIRAIVDEMKWEEARVDSHTTRMRSLGDEKRKAERQEQVIKRDIKDVEKKLIEACNMKQMRIFVEDLQQSAEEGFVIAGQQAKAVKRKKNGFEIQF